MDVKPRATSDRASDVEKASDVQEATRPALDDAARRVAEKKLVRKIDTRMSILVLIYILNYIDRSNLSSARTKGFEEDLHLTGSQYPTTLSILFVGYVLMQVPSNLLLQYTGRPSIYIPTAMAIWGLISVMTGVTYTFVGALLTRFFLGFVEAAFFPGALFILSRWYKRDELGLRSAILYIGSLIALAFSPLMAAGILSRMEGVRGIRAWRWLFYIEGSATIFVALLTVFILPDFPHNSRGFSPEERNLAVLRMTEDGAATSVEIATESMSTFESLKDALTDPKLWVLSFSTFGVISGLSFSQFFPTLSETLGYDATISLLLCAPPFVFAAVVAFLNARHSDLKQERFLHIVVPYTFGVLGFIIAMSTTKTAPRYVSLFLMASSFSGLPFNYAWISNSQAGFPRPVMKRAICYGFVNCLSQTGNICGAYFFPKAWGPTYQKSFGICIGTYVFCIAGLAYHRHTLGQGNKVEAAKRVAAGLEPEDAPYYVL